jgi:mRNA-degrading endonuclease toxin of MazEF toxin-antitoxin module
VYFTDLGRLGRKRVLVVSYEAINRGLGQPVCALITSRDRPRSLNTYVEIDPPDGGVTETSFILCHHLQTLLEAKMDEKPEGFISGPKMLEVHAALKKALDLP